MSLRKRGELQLLRQAARLGRIKAGKKAAFMPVLMQGVKGRVATFESDTLIWHIGNRKKACEALRRRWIDVSSLLSWTPRLDTV